MNTYMQNKITKEIIQVSSNFNWGACLLGGIYYLFKGMGTLGFIIWLLDCGLAVFTLGLGNIIFGIYRGCNFKNQLITHLKSNDYILYPIINQN